MEGALTTLRDISRHLGLSVTQVSRALNGHSDVGADTRERVLEAAKALNYQPNLSARKLVSGRSGIVGLVLPGVPAPQFDSLFVQIVGGLSRHFSARAMQFVLHIADPEEDPVRVYERLVNSGSLDGFVILEPVENDARIAYLQARKVPFVLHGRHRLKPDYPFYDIDNEGVGHALGSLLLEQGHRRIALLNGVAARTYSEARLSGFRRAFAEAGARFESASVLNGEMTDGFGLLSVARLWADGTPPTGIACGNMMVAKGVLAALQAMGLSVPADVSVVAHDDALPGMNSALMPVPLTVTYSPLQDSWKPLAELLAGAVAGEKLVDLQRFGQFEIVRRASVGLPPKSL